MKLNKLFEREKKKETPKDDCLRIDCRKCEKPSDYGNPACVRCMSSKLKSIDKPKKIVLDSVVEKEYFGEAVDVIWEISECVPAIKTTKSAKCANCKKSPEKIDSEMWDSFSSTGIDSIITKLENAETDCDECKNCVLERIKELGETRNRLLLVSKKTTASANRMVGA